MATRHRIGQLLIVSGLLCATSLAAQSLDLGQRLPLTIDADNTVYDGIARTVVYSGVRITQGNISIEADEARAALQAQQEGKWTFSGNVTIDVDQGHIECEIAELSFVDGILTTATVSGQPATFTVRRSAVDDVTEASAGRLSYDVVAGIVEFSDEATISEAGNQISSNTLVYNISERKINADSSGSGEDRVRVIYTPENDAPADGEEPDINQ